MDRPPEWTQIVGGFFGGGALTTLAAIWRDRHKAHAQSRKFEADAQQTLSRMVDERLRLLIDGYERRIADLTSEVHSLRAEIVELRQALTLRSVAEAATHPRVELSQT